LTKAEADEEILSGMGNLVNVLASYNALHNCPGLEANILTTLLGRAVQSATDIADACNPARRYVRLISESKNCVTIDW